MHIAVAADPRIPVPPELYGGIERIVDMLVRGLVDRGHDVTLFAHEDSDVPCRHIPYSGTDPQAWGDVLRDTLSISRLAVEQPDVVHSFGRLVYLTPLLPLNIPKIMSYQREVTRSRARGASFFARPRTLIFTGCSDYITEQIRPYAPARTIYNGVPLHAYDFQPNLPSDAPLIFLGRIEHMKGIDIAVETALHSGRRLIIAGNVPEESEKQDYFEAKVAPHIDERKIQYVGVVDDKQKNELFGRSAALLMPTRYPEAFGIVMAEAMACGTPVIGTPRGAVPEVVEEGVTGFVGKDVEDLVAAVDRIDELDRAATRERCERLFSDRAVVDSYESLYEEMIVAQR